MQLQKEIGARFLFRFKTQPSNFSWSCALVERTKIDQSRGWERTTISTNEQGVSNIGSLLLFLLFLLFDHQNEWSELLEIVDPHESFCLWRLPSRKVGWLLSSMTRFGEICHNFKWATLAKLDKSSAKFWQFFYLFGKMFSLLWQIWYIIGPIFIVANGQILKNNQNIWSHCSLDKLDCLTCAICMNHKPKHLNQNVQVLTYQ